MTQGAIQNQEETITLYAKKTIDRERDQNALCMIFGSIFLLIPVGLGLIYFAYWYFIGQWQQPGTHVISNNSVGVLLMAVCGVVCVIAAPLGVIVGLRELASNVSIKTPAPRAVCKIGSSGILAKDSKGFNCELKWQKIKSASIVEHEEQKFIGIILGDSTNMESWRPILKFVTEEMVGGELEERLLYTFPLLIPVSEIPIEANQLVSILNERIHHSH